MSFHSFVVQPPAELLVSERNSLLNFMQTATSICAEAPDVASSWMMGSRRDLKGEPLNVTGPGPSICAAGDAKAAGVVLRTQSGKILAGWDPRKQKWSEPGGKRNAGESMQDCAARELLEATGLRAGDVKIDWSTPSCVDVCQYVFFQGELGERQPTPTQELVKFGEISVSDSRSDFSFRLQQVLANLAKHIPCRPKPKDLANFGEQPLAELPVAGLSGGNAPAPPPPNNRKCGPDGGQDCERGSEYVVPGTSNLRIVLCDLQYKVDTAALEAHANTPEASATWASPDETEVRSKMTERDYIRQFLNSKRMKRLPDGSGVCTFSYRHTDIGQALQDAGFLENGGRLYPDAYPCATQLGSKLRNCALGAHYMECDDADAFHRYLQTLSTNPLVQTVLEELAGDKTYRKRLAEHYFGDEARTKPIKTLLHMMANDGLCKDWRREHKIPKSIPDHPLVERFGKAMETVTEELATRGHGPAAIAYIEKYFPTKWKLLRNGKKRKVARDAKLTWKSYLLQSLECKGLLKKMRVAEAEGVHLGPPLHDGLFVEKLSDPRKTQELAQKMSRAVSDSTGAHVVVEIKEIPSAPLEYAFELDFEQETFMDTDFRSNLHLEDEHAIAQSLETYNKWLSRFFVAILKGRKSEAVELFYWPGTDRIKDFQKRTYKSTMEIYVDMPIHTTAEGKVIDLLEWYLLKNPKRRTADGVEMCVTEEEVAAHPRHLNIFGGLPFDERFSREADKDQKPFEDPFPAAFEDARGCTKERSHEPDWRELSGLRFILWHVRFILCGGDTGLFQYVMLWFAFVMQKRTKPSTILVLYGAQGIGKSAIVSINESTRAGGILPRIYGGIEKGGYFQTAANIHHILKDFNAENVNKLFCCLEEATSSKRCTRNNDQLAALISNQVLRGEYKGCDAVTVTDHRAFVCCTNNRDAFKITEDDRRHVLCEGDERFSQRAVREGHCTQKLRMEYMTKLSATIDDEIAYEFFAYCMRLDITDFKPQALYETDLHREQQSQNACALKAFLEAASCGEYSFVDTQCDQPLSMPGQCENGVRHLSSLQLMEHFRRYLQQSGLCSGIDNVKSMGWHVKRYPDLIQRLGEGKYVKYAIKRRV